MRNALNRYTLSYYFSAARYKLRAAAVYGRFHRGKAAKWMPAAGLIERLPGVRSPAKP
jgi:hypothetical protein